MARVVSVIFPLVSIGFMSPVDFKKWPCRPVDFKGQEPWLSPPTADVRGPPGVGAFMGAPMSHVDFKVREG